MRFWLLGLAVVLAVHVLATTTASLLVAARYGRARGWLAALPPAERASRLLLAALIPFAVGLACAALVVPAWLIHEPRRLRKSWLRSPLTPPIRK